MRKGEELWGYIDTTGQFAISPRFETYPNGYVYPFSDGMAKIEAKGLFGFIDHSGVFAIPPQLLDAESFSDGMARVVSKVRAFTCPKAVVEVSIRSFQAFRIRSR